LIVTALLGDADFAWLDGLRRRHYPPDRNYVCAHLTLFHHIMPSLEDEVVRLIKSLTRQAAPDACVTGVINLGGGTAFRFDSAALVAIRDQIADRLWDTLIPQDRAPWRAHVTVQNKVKADVARRLFSALSADFTPRRADIAGLAVWRYRGGPWEPLGAWRFGQGHAMVPPSKLPG
jgi:hypothetical protein